MCDYTQVEFACGHLRYIVRAWCVRYQETHKRCPANVVAIEYRLDEKCGDCKETSSTKSRTHKPITGNEGKDEDASASSSKSAGDSK